MSEPNDASAGFADKLVGTVLADRYRLDELLGEGGMGKVYAAEHVFMSKRLAVKVLHRELCESPEVVARFRREAMATANIDHPNIASATDCGELPDGSLFLVLELVLGKSLRDEIAAGPMPLARALHIARQIASALTAAHALGIVHRDLKPENVMLVTRGSDPDFVKVLDFGIAKVPMDSPDAGSARRAPSAPLTKAGTVFGTPAYMSPEQALGQSVDNRTDLYALGVITYELLSGVRPFAAKSDSAILGQQLAKPVPAFAERAPGVSIPRQVELMVQKLLARDVGSRFQTAQEVVQAFHDLLTPTAAESRQFTLLDGSPTAFLGTAEQVYAGPPAEARAAPAEGAAPAAQLTEPLLVPEAPTQVSPQAPPPKPRGPGGTLPLLDAQRSRDLAERAAARSAPTSPAAAMVARGAAAAWLALSAVFDSIDKNRRRLPERVRHLLRKVPASVLLVAVVVPVWGAMLVPVVLIASARLERSSKAGGSSVAPSAQEPVPDPLVAELAEAKKQGHAALQKLAERHPTDARVQLELALSHASHSDHGAAVAALGRALAADPETKADPRASELLTVAVRKRDSANAAFELLAGAMGAPGATALYDLSIDQKADAALVARAQKWVVQSGDFSKVAPPNVLVAARLRYGKSCSDRHSLLPKAGEVGDQRALAYLKIMKYGGGCGRRGHDDCFPCMRKDKALDQATEAIQKRLGEKR